MHNGEISGFAKIKRALQASLPEELFLFPSGYTGQLAAPSPFSS
jgi:glutamine amidotransferase